MRLDEKILFLTAATATCVCYALYKRFARRRNSIHDFRVASPALDGEIYDASDYAYGPLTRTLSAMMPVSRQSKETLTSALRNAGYYSPHAWENFSATWYLILITPLIFCGSLLVAAPMQFEFPVMIGLVIGTALGWALPSLYIRSKAVNRLREISNGMPDMLDLLNMCVAQGMTVNAALRRVGQEIRSVYPALAKELSIVTDQAQIGSLSQGLTNMSQRVDLPEVRSLSNLLTQTEKLGTSVAAALAEYADGMRESMQQRADEKANSATFKLLFPTVLCLMPAVYLFLMGPSIVELDRFFEQGATEAFRAEMPEQFIQGN